MFLSDKTAEAPCSSKHGGSKARTAIDILQPHPATAPVPRLQSAPAPELHKARCQRHLAVKPYSTTSTQAPNRTLPKTSWSSTVQRHMQRHQHPEHAGSKAHTANHCSVPLGVALHPFPTWLCSVTNSLGTATALQGDKTGRRETRRQRQKRQRAHGRQHGRQGGNGSEVMKGGKTGRQGSSGSKGSDHDGSMAWGRRRQRQRRSDHENRQNWETGGRGKKKIVDQDPLH